MIKVAIFDDEVKICKLIHKLIEWDELGMEFIGFAHDGISGLELIKEKNPDIVITDIRMPGYEGIEIIERTRAINSDIQFIIISGYSHFEYTKSAIKYGVKDYILKPIRKEELMTTLTKIKNEINEKLADDLDDEKINQKLKAHDIYVKEDLIRRMYTEELDNETWNTIISGQADDSFHLSPIIYKIDGSHNLDSLIFHSLKNYFEVNTDLKFIGYSDSHQISGVLNGSGKLPLTRIIKRSIDDVYFHLGKTNESIITAIVGEAANDPSNLFISASKVKEAVVERLVQSDNLINVKNILPQESYALDDLYEKYNRHLEIAIKDLDETLFSDNMKLLKEEIKSVSNLKGKDFIQLVQDLSRSFQVVLTNHMDVKSIEATVNKQIETARDYLELFDNLKKTYIGYISQIKKNQGSKEVHPIRKAKEYIDKNYMNPIGLDLVGEVVGLNPTYLSNLFRIETNETFTDYLIGVRIQMAKELLRTTNDNISEICSMVGYNDQKHFTKLFKKSTGLRPSEYRKIHA